MYPKPTLLNAGSIPVCVTYADEEFLVFVYFILGQIRLGGMFDGDGGDGKVMQQRPLTPFSLSERSIFLPY